MSATNKPNRKSKPTARISGLINNKQSNFDYMAARKAVEEKRRRVLVKLEDLTVQMNRASDAKSGLMPRNACNSLSYLMNILS